jgi:cytoplasmic iron level regulating protein YaaA (DUF328/UPF0246 family)
MLLIVPPSETKRASPAEGAPVDLDRLAFPELAPTRRRVIDALIETSGRPDAFERLQAPPSMLHDVAMNTYVLDLPAMPAHELYTGPLHEGLDLGSVSGAARARAAQEVVITSPLWGALRPFDEIPRYRLHVISRLVGLHRTDHVWRAVLPGVFDAAAGANGPIVDLRSALSQSMGMPSEQANQTVTLRVDQGVTGHRIGDVIAKRVRGQAARQLLDADSGPRDAEDVADILATRWTTRLSTATGQGSRWSVTLSVAT